MGGARQTILSVYWCGDWRMGNFLSNDAQPFHNPVREGLSTIRSELCLKNPVLGPVTWASDILQLIPASSR
jgi:hypothetical protein